jgi:hypothetical protein
MDLIACTANKTNAEIWDFSPLKVVCKKNKGGSGKWNMFGDVPVNRQNAENCSPPIIFFLFSVMEGDRDNEEEGDSDGDGKGARDGDREGDVNMKRRS